MLHTRFFTLTLTTSLVVLSGCTTFAPQSMPKGYTYQDNTPLSSPAPSSPWHDKAVITNTENMGTNTAAWQGSVYELMDKMDANLPKDGSPLNLVAEDSSNQSLAFDHYLRQTLIQKGYNLTTLPKTGTPLFYGVKKAKDAHAYVLTTSLKDAKGDKTISSASVNAVLPFEK